MDVPDFVREDSLVERFSVHEETNREDDRASSLYVSAYMKASIPPFSTTTIENVIGPLGGKVYQKDLTYRDWSGDTSIGNNCNFFGLILMEIRRG